MRQFQGKKLLVASHNEGKIREIRELLTPFSIEVVSAKDLNLPEPEETGTTFEENSLLKARACMEASGLPSLSDDSGLVVTALGGDPGVYSARWAEGKEGETRDFYRAMARVESELQGNQDRSAYFVCVLTLIWPDSQALSFEGRVYGHLTFPPRGNKGMGYDPIFIPNGYQMTFGEMEVSLKNRISHRSVALRKLIESCF